MENLKTTLHRYRYDTRKPDEAAAWKELEANLNAEHPHCMESWGSKRNHFCTAIDIAQLKLGNGNLDTIEIELETKHLFANQWNTAPIGEHIGFRVFDWALDYKGGGSGDPMVKQGYWLEQTEEMRRLRAETLHCGYCGKQYPRSEAPADGFCNSCLDSEYLKEENLNLLRLRQIEQDKPHARRAELTEAEREWLLPKYQHVQIHGSTKRGVERIAKLRERIEADYEKTVRNATVERDGKRWIMDNMPGMLENAIYYNHTGRWCFGWRSALGNGTRDALLELITEFPFSYEIKCVEGGPLQGDR